MVVTIRKTREVYDWNQIKDIVLNGEAPEKLPVGTELIQELTDGTRAVIVVVALNLHHENEAIFAFKDNIGPDHVMNEDYTNAGGWKNSEMRRYLNNEFLDFLPDEMTDVIHKKKTRQIIDGVEVKCKDLLWLPSEYEVFGEEIYAKHNGRDKQFEYYTDRRNRISLPTSGESSWKWLASPYASNTTNFCNVYGCGNAIYTNASNSFGVAPGFVIR